MKPAHSTPAKPESAPIHPAILPLKRWWWAGAALAAGVTFVVSALFASRHTLTGGELSVFRSINEWTDALRGFFMVVTIAPDSLWIAAAVVVVTFLLKMYRLAWQLAVGTVAGYIIAYLAKHFIARPRPVELVHDVSVRVHDSGMGFPSGHTMIMTVIVLTMWPYLPKGWRWGVAVLIPLMALSRVYLGVHAPLDVMGGFAIGVVVVACMRILPHKLRAILHFN